jgi:hypothetical protein
MAIGRGARRRRSSPTWRSISAAPHTSTRSTLPNAAGNAPSNNLQYAGSISDAYSRGTSLQNYDVSFIVGTAIVDQALPLDPSRASTSCSPSADVAETSGFETAVLRIHTTTGL